MNICEYIKGRLHGKHRKLLTHYLGYCQLEHNLLLILSLLFLPLQWMLFLKNRNHYQREQFLLVKSSPYVKIGHQEGEII